MSGATTPVHRFAAARMREMAAPARTALLAIDVQVGWATFPAAETAIDRIEALIGAARAAGVAGAFARVVTRPGTNAANLGALYERLGFGVDAAAICRAGAPDAAFHRVCPAPGDVLVEKTRYSAFAGTDLAAALRARGIDTVVATGLTTDCCVDCTVRDAFHQDFHVFLVADACAAAEERHHLASLDGLGRHCAVVVDAATVIGGWMTGGEAA